MKAQVICRADGTIKAFRVDGGEADPARKIYLFPAASERSHEVEISAEHEDLFKPGVRTEVSRLKEALAGIIAKKKAG